MKFSIVYWSLTIPAALTVALQYPGIHRRQDVNSEVETAYVYLYRMCSPDAHKFYFGGGYIPNFVNSTAPCDQRDYIFANCAANSTVPEVDFAAEQQCLCGSNLWDAWLGCDECYRVHGYPEEISGTEEQRISAMASLSSAECAASPYPSVNFRDLLNISTLMSAPPLTLTSDRFPNQTAVSNYWTTNTLSTPRLGSITGIATGRATVRTDFPGLPSSSESLISSSAATVTSSPTLSGSGSASGSGSGSAAGVATTLSTAAAGDVTVASGVVLVFVNVVAVLLL